MLPLALALGLQCWLSVTDRVTNERSRAMGLVACVLAVCVLGAEQVSSGVSDEVAAGFEAAAVEEEAAAAAAAAAAEPGLPQAPSMPLFASWGGSSGSAQDSTSGWWQPSPPSSWSWAPSPAAEMAAGVADAGIADRELPHAFASGVGGPVASASSASLGPGPMTRVVRRATFLVGQLCHGAVAAWRSMRGAPSTVTWEHAAFLGLGLSIYVAFIVSRRRAPTHLRVALAELEDLNKEIRTVAEHLDYQNRNNATSPERLRRRRRAAAESGSPGKQSEEITPRRMDMTQLLSAAEEPQLIWQFTDQEQRSRLTEAARKYREVDASLKQLCRRISSFDMIGLDDWWGRTKRYEVATDCALACVRARGQSSLTHHSADQLEELLKKRDGGWMVKLDSDGDGRLTEREIHTHIASASQVRPPDKRRWQPPAPSDDAEDGGVDSGPRGLPRRLFRTIFGRRQLTVGIDGEPCQDWLLGVVWVLLVLLTPDDEFEHAENLCKRLVGEYGLPSAWFRRLVDIRRDQMEEQAQGYNHWTRQLRRRSGSVGYILAGVALLLLTDVLPASGFVSAWGAVVSVAQRQMLRLLVLAKAMTTLAVLALLVEVLLWLGLFVDRAPGAWWRYRQRAAVRLWCKRRWDPPSPAFRVEEEALADEDEIDPQMDHAGRVLYKRYNVPTHPDWHRCVPADGSATFYVKESTGQREWVLPKLDDDDDDDWGFHDASGGGGGAADGEPPPSAAWNMHTGVSGSGRHGGRGNAWPKWLEATETVGADLTSAEAARLNALPPSPAQLAEAEERTRQATRQSTGSDAGSHALGRAGGEAPGRVRPNLVVSRLRKSNWERVRDVVAPHEGIPGEAPLNADELERQELLKLAQEARKAAERADRPPPTPTNPLWKPPGGGRSLVEEEREGLQAWRSSRDRFGSSSGQLGAGGGGGGSSPARQGQGTGVGKSLDELPPPPWMMEKAERDFRLTVEKRRDELNMKLATEQVEMAKKRKEEREREAARAVGGVRGLLSPVKALLSPSASSSAAGPRRQARSPPAGDW